MTLFLQYDELATIVVLVIGVYSVQFQALAVYKWLYELLCAVYDCVKCIDSVFYEFHVIPSALCRRSRCAPCRYM